MALGGIGFEQPLQISSITHRFVKLLGDIACLGSIGIKQRCMFATPRTSMSTVSFTDLVAGRHHESANNVREIAMNSRN